ncbi:MAG: HD domain-containing protein [Bacteroidales bacterium]|nr:HD domain-containing protein [Bacteroidales bacterium]
MIEVDKKIDKIFRTVSAAAAHLGVRAFVIGGYVRDYFLGKPSEDVDIVVEGSGIALAKEVASMLGEISGRELKVTVFKSFGTAMLKFRGVEVEFVGARRESYNRDSRNPIVEDGTLEEDQCRRDFTINAMAFSLQEDDYGTLVDPFGGIADMAAGIIRTPLDPDTTYSDDPLRMLRAVRFASRLGFQIVPESIESMRRNRDRLEILSAERISEELGKMLMTDHPSRAFYLLDECDLLDKILPEVAALKGVETVQGRGHKDNFAHSLQVLDNVAESGADLWLRWAALLHDIGKPVTKKWDEKLGWTFHNHDYMGARMVPAIFARLKMPLNEKMKYVQKLVSLHLRPIALVTDEVTDSAVRRLVFDAGDDVDDLMTLCKADITSKNLTKVETFRRNYTHVQQKIVEVEEKDRIRNFKNPITGEVVMKRFNIPPGNIIGTIKEVVKNAILDGEIPNEFDAAYALMEKVAKEMGLE